MTNKEIKGEGYYWALLCDCGMSGKDKYGVCGVYPSKKEAQEVADEVEGCPCEHTIKKCRVKINL